MAHFCNSMIFYPLVPTRASYAAAEFGAGPAASGALASSFFIGALAARLVSGWLAPRLSPRILGQVAAVG